MALLHYYMSQKTFFDCALINNLFADPEIKAEIQPYIDHLHKIVNEVVGRTEAEQSDTPCAGGECVIGDLITDSMLNAVSI